jgi:hypothetical protein
MGDFAGEVPAILQEGERVLSRSEVATMGGPGGVERAARGGNSGGTIVINAMDAASVQQLFESRRGRGLINALRTGRSPLTPVFGRG